MITRKELARICGILARNRHAIPPLAFEQLLQDFSGYLQEVNVVFDDNKFRTACTAQQPVEIVIAPLEISREAQLNEALKDVVASLTAAHSLLSRGGKSAAPSDTMFEIMLSDYAKTITRGREAILETSKDTRTEEEKDYNLERYSKGP